MPKLRMKSTKKNMRLKRARRSRAKITQLNVVRLCVHRTPRHVYAQLIAPQSKVLASASTLDKAIRAKGIKTGNIEAAKLVGKLIAERGVGAGVSKIAFDRSGYKYHGRVRALADAAREAGLEI